MTGALVSPSFVVFSLQAPETFLIFPFLFLLVASFCFLILHQHLDGVAWCAIECNSLGAG